MRISRIICNRCGVELDTCQTVYEGHHLFGYGTRFDSYEIEFDLCEECLTDIIVSFKYPPQTTVSSEQQSFIESFLKHKVNHGLQDY